jgi:hypothetical protein
MRKPNRIMLASAVACFICGLGLYLLSRTGYITFRMTTWHLVMVTWVALLVLFFAFFIPAAEKPRK